MKNAFYLLNVFRIFCHNTDKEMNNIVLCDETLCSFAGIY